MIFVCPYRLINKSCRGQLSSNIHPKWRCFVFDIIVLSHTCFPFRTDSCSKRLGVLGIKIEITDTTKYDTMKKVFLHNVRKMIPGIIFCTRHAKNITGFSESQFFKYQLRQKMIHLAKRLYTWKTYVDLFLIFIPTFSCLHTHTHTHTQRERERFQGTLTFFFCRYIILYCGLCLF